MRKSSNKMNITLIALTAVAVLLALLLFLDVVVPVFPTSLEPSEDGTEPSEDMADGTEPPISLETEFPSVSGEDLPLLEFPHYTEEELMGLFQNPLEYALIYLAEKEAVGEIPPIDRVGFFDLNRNGVPEVITMGVYDGSVEYTAYELYSMEALSSWGWEGTQYGELSLWSWPLAGISSSSVSTMTYSWRAFMTHTGDGNDEYLCEFKTNTVCEERYARTVSTLSVSSFPTRALGFRLYGQKVDETAYTESYERFIHMNFPVPETTMVTAEWNASDPEGLTEKLLTSGQWFLYDGK